MFIVNIATTAVCALYGAYVYRVLRRAEYHDLKWFFRRRCARHPGKSAATPSVTHPSDSQPYRTAPGQGAADEYCIDRGVLRPVRRSQPRPGPAKER